MVKVTATLDTGAHAASSAFSAPSDVVSKDKGAGGSEVPQTILLKHPRKKTHLARVKFTFVSNQASAHFECKLDKKPFKSCRSPFKVKKLRHGRHSFQARAVSSAGVADPTPASYRWKIS
jgi:hypothetical protein